MFDENVCFSCGQTTSDNNIYCSDVCRRQDCGDGSASASNSSVAPSSASSSPSRGSPKLVPSRQQRTHRSNAHARYLERYSTASSRTSSPSLHTSDLPEFSDNDADLGFDRKGGDFGSSLAFRTPQRVLDHTFWRSRYAEFGVAAPVNVVKQEVSVGSKSVPGTPTALQYVRKPGPINVSANPGASKLLTSPSPYKLSHSHKRFGSEYAYPVHTTYSNAESATQERIARKGSTESATSSTPRSKSAAVLAASTGGLQTSASESTLSHGQPIVATGTMRHVSDTIVHTLRRAVEPFTAVEVQPPKERQVTSDALSALKNVARTHGMYSGTSRASTAYSRTVDRPTQPTTDVSWEKMPAVAPLQDNFDWQYVDADDESRVRQVEPETRGRSRKRPTASRSPSPPSWASWAENEPIDRRRGRSAHRGK